MTDGLTETQKAEIAREVIQATYNDDSLPQLLGEALGQEAVLVVLLGENVEFIQLINGKVPQNSKTYFLFDELCKLLNTSMENLMEKAQLKETISQTTLSEIPTS